MSRKICRILRRVDCFYFSPSDRVRAGREEDWPARRKGNKSEKKEKFTFFSYSASPLPPVCLAAWRGHRTCSILFLGSRNLSFFLGRGIDLVSQFRDLWSSREDSRRLKPPISLSCRHPKLFFIGLKKKQESATKIKCLAGYYFFVPRKETSPSPSRLWPHRSDSAGKSSRRL